MESKERAAIICFRPTAGPMLARLARATLTPAQMEEFTQAILEARADGRDQIRAAQEKYLELTGRTAQQAFQAGGRDAMKKYLAEVKAEEEPPLPVIEPMRIDGWDV